MEVYRVGGAIRDKLLGKTPSDLDYVVVGSSVEEMLSLGYTQVGRDFPVFLHPESSDEYALARQERLSGDKFVVGTNDVTLEQDLLRRDLTINAIAMDLEDNLIDPYGGCKDLAEGVLRPVSEAFKEDPLRVLRAARLKCTLGGHWVISNELKEYANDMKLLYTSMPKERVYKELVKVLASDKPSVFFRALDELNVLNDFFPEIYKMKSMEHDNPYHMEGSVFNHTMLVVDQCETQVAKIAALFHDIGKVPCKQTIGTFHGHSDEQWVKPAFETMRTTYGFSSEEFKVAEYVALNHHRWQNVIDGHTGSKKFLKLLLGIRDGKFLSYVLEAVYADMLGRYGIKKPFVYSQLDIRNMWYTITKHKTDCSGLTTEQIKQKVYREKLNLLKELINEA